MTFTLNNIAMNMITDSEIKLIQDELTNGIRNLGCSRDELDRIVDKDLDREIRIIALEREFEWKWLQLDAEHKIKMLLCKLNEKSQQKPEERNSSSICN